MNARLSTLASWLVTLLTPLALILFAVRLLLTPIFLQVEYRLPGFPEDPYGFTQQERLYWSRFALDYLLNDAGIEYLGDLRFPESGSPVFNARELRHMVDVKVLTRYTLGTAYTVWGLLVVLGVWARRGKWWQAYGRGLRRGGWATVMLVAAVLLFVVISFEALFTAFHRVFFEGDTWLFLYSDTLIRLFPMRFWQDTFLFVGLFALAGGLALALGVKSSGQEGG
ncbi:MAG: TIGR01906 family membrane protein [Anaerolineae bacterium]|nr:MAG: TIGR01906 family membrane protein [Anaerolineae bacterium]